MRRSASTGRSGSRLDRITGDSGALTGRELPKRSGVAQFLAAGIPGQPGRAADPALGGTTGADAAAVGQTGPAGSQRRLGATGPPGAAARRQRPAGTAPLGGDGRLPSQPTLSQRWRSGRRRKEVQVLREGLQRLAGWRLKAMGGRRPKKLVVDVDSLPVEVHREQPVSAWNGYYHRRVYHPMYGVGGSDGRHAGPAAAGGTGTQRQTAAWSSS